MRRICAATAPRMVIVAGADPEVEADDLGGASAFLPKARSAADLVGMLEFTALLLEATDSLLARR